MTRAEQAAECLKLANRLSRQALDQRRRFGRRDIGASRLTEVAAFWRGEARRVIAAKP